MGRFLGLRGVLFGFHSVFKGFVVGFHKGSISNSILDTSKQYDRL